MSCPNSHEWEEVVELCGLELWGDVKLRIRELPMADGVYASTGNQVWSTSVFCAHALLQLPELVQGKVVVEIGAGCGLVGIVVARLARRTILTDGDEEVVQNLQYNLDLNKSWWQENIEEAPREVRTQRLDWNSIAHTAWPEQDSADVVIACDVLYGHWGDKVAIACLHILAAGGVIIIVVSEDRRSGAVGFKEVLKNANFRVVESEIVTDRGEFRMYECRENEPGKGAEHLPLSARIDTQISVKVGPPQQLPEAPPVRWKVVGGLERGIIVRSGPGGAVSGYLGRLRRGAVIQQISNTGLRLEYSKLTGNGPVWGWVTILSAKGTTLVSLLSGSDLDDERLQ